MKYMANMSGRFTGDGYVIRKSVEDKYKGYDKKIPPSKQIAPYVKFVLISVECNIWNKTILLKIESSRNYLHGLM